MRAGIEQTWSVAPYSGDDDLQEILALVRRGVVDDPGGVGVLHPGDVVWRLFQNTTIVPEERVRLVRDASGALAGIIWLSPPAEFDLFVPPDVPNMGSLVPFMIRQTEGMVKPGERPRAPEVPDHQARLAAILAECGYAPTGNRPYFCNVQSLAGKAIPAPSRPVRAVEAGDLDARVEIHRRVWNPSKFTREGYERLRQRPVYRPDLDLVAVTPGGDLAAYAIVWWDPATRAGEFEPVGADPAFRRQGYATAVMREGLRRLQALGAERVIVLSESDAESAPANALYRATGFEPAFMLAEWEKG